MSKHLTSRIERLETWAWGSSPPSWLPPVAPAEPTPSSPEQDKPMNPADRELRERLLALAVCNHRTGTDPITEAGRYFDFVIGKDERNVRTTVLDALNQAGVD